MSATPSQGTYDRTTGTWTLGTVNLGGPETLRHRGPVPSAPSPQTNTATITHSDQFDPAPGNNPLRRGHAAAGRPRGHQGGQRPDAPRRRHAHLHRRPGQRRPPPPPGSPSPTRCRPGSLCLRHRQSGQLQPGDRDLDGGHGDHDQPCRRSLIEATVDSPSHRRTPRRSPTPTSSTPTPATTQRRPR